MASPNPDCPPYRWRHRQQQGSSLITFSKGLLASLPPGLVPVLARGKGLEPPPTEPGPVVRDSSPMAVVSKGITLRGLRKLRARLLEFFGPEAYAVATTADVNSAFVQVVTAQHQCRLAELPSVLAPEDVGVPHYFISHAWKNRFDLLLRGIEAFLQSAAEDTRVWIDIAAVNQHPTSGFQAADVGAFKDVVRAASGGTLVVMDLSSCNPATRAWCIYEWAATVGWHGPDGMHMQVGTADRAALVGGTDVEAAECFNPADKVAILADVVAQHGSTAAFNSKLKLQLLLEPLSYRVDLRRLTARAAGTAWDFRPVSDWAAAGRAGARVLCVTAGAGEGKSTISAALCESEALAGLVSAHHFIKYSDQRRLEVERAVKSLAFQLGNRYASVGAALLSLDVAKVAAMHDGAEACEALLKRPLARAFGPDDESSQVVLLLDALDEADPPPVAQPGSGPPPDGSAAPPASPASARVPVCANKLFMLLVSQLRSLPPCARFIVTTRPDALGGGVRAALDRAFQDSGGVTYVAAASLRDGGGGDAGGGGGGGGDAGGGGGGGGGMLVYHTLAKEFFGGSSAGALAAPPPLSRPPQLEDVYGAYGRVFDSGMASLRGDAERAAVRRTLCVLLAAQEPLPHSLLHAMGLGALERVPGAPVTFFIDEHHAYSLHKSLSDFLCDARSSGPYAVDVAAGHAALAAQLLSSVRSGGAPSTYALKYLVRHLVAANDMPALEELLSCNHEFLAAAFAQRHGHALIRDALRANRPSPLLRDCQRWLLARQHELAEAKTAAEVRATVLRCPADTLLFRTTERRLLAELAEAGRPAWRLSRAIGRSPTWPEVRLDAQGHKEVVRCVRWSPDGRTLASGCEAGEFRLWDAQSGECIAMLQTEGKSINSVQWRPDGLKLATGGDDKQLRVWDATGGQCELVVEGHTDIISGCSWSPCGRFLASSSKDGSVRVADAASGACVAALEGHRYAVCVAWSPDGRIIASGASDRLVRLWSTASGEWGADAGEPTCFAELKGHKRSLTGLAWSNDGAKLASSSQDSDVRVWAAPSGEWECVSLAVGHERDSICCCFSPDDTTLASGGADNTLRFWTYQDADGKYQPQATQLSVLQDHMAVSLDWSRDGSTIASCNGGRSFWLLDAGDALLGTRFQAHTRTVNWVLWTADGSQLISASADCTIRIWDGASGTCTSTLAGGLRRDIRCVASSPDGGTLVSCGQSSELTLWNTHTGKAQAFLSGHTGRFVNQVAWRSGSGGRTLASACSDATVRLWVLDEDMQSGSCTAVLTDHSQEVACVAWHPTDGAVLASGGYDLVVRLWAVAEDATSATCTAVLEGHAKWIAFLAWSPDGKTLVSSSGGGDKLRVWAVEGGSEAQCTHEVEDPSGFVYGVSWHPSGLEFVTTSYKSLRVYDAASAQLTAVLEGHSVMVMGVCWRPDGKVVAGSSFFNEILLYERV